MDLLIAIKEYCDKLIEYNFYPKKKKPSLGKLEKYADLMIDGKFRKLERYIPETADKEQLSTLTMLMEKIKEIANNERES